MDCSRARDLIDAFLLDDLDPRDAARLAAHVRGCAACTAEIGSSTRVLSLLGSLAVPRPTPDLDERILVAALEDRGRRHARRSWLADLRTQVLRGAMRTTGTLVLTIMSVALLGGAFVFAASQFVVPVINSYIPRATIPPVATPTTSVPAAQTAEPSTIATTPSPAVSLSPEPVLTPSPSSTAEPSVSTEPSPSATPEPTPTPTPEPSVEPTPSATAEPTPTPTPEPTPDPTEKPRRTPPPSASPSTTPQASQPSP
jgi:hypothetical protein